ncbi:MAG: MFS transporter [Caldilineaceae bacterium]
MSEHVAQRQSSELPAASSGAGRAGIILTTLIVVAAVANLPLAMANVALPSIGSFFNATQTQLNLVAVSYSLGLACSVLWFGALGDRNGRKLMLILGVSLAMPAAGLRLCTEHPDPHRGAAGGRFCRGHGLPHHALVDRRALGPGSGPHPLHRAGPRLAAPSTRRDR